VRMRAGSDVMAVRGNSAGSLVVWYRAVRLHYVPPSFLPAILCSVIAWCSGYRPDIVGFVLVVTGVTINHFGLNMLDDVCDYRHSVDREREGESNPYTGGSGVLTEGLLTPAQLTSGAVVCFIVTALIGFYLTWTHGWPVLAFGLFGMFCSVFYTLPPVKFGYRGLGELGLLINFGPVIGLGAYYIQAGSIALAPLILSLVMGMMMWSMIVINEIPDFEEDRAGRKRTLVVRLGRSRAVSLYLAGLVSAYLVLLAAVWTRLAPLAALAGLVSLPLSVKSALILKANYLHKVRMIPANLSMIKVHLLTGIALIAAFLSYLLQIHGWSVF
jgi:1,4-dihydroxy-2-naphthoate polyprenyltransferase